MKKPNRNKVRHWLIVVFSLVVCSTMGLAAAGCKEAKAPEAPEVPGPAERVLVRAEKIGEYKVADIRARFDNNPLIVAAARYDLRVYRIVYRTRNVDGKTIEASGALMVPVAEVPLPLVSQQHGTITEDRSAPSNYGRGSEAWSLGSALASSGYVVSAPDYIGYGASKNQPHPYEHAASLASASADMLRAALEYCADNRVSLNDKLFLTGYSEGGFATMALHRHLEEDLGDEFTVTASAPGAGAYHKTAFARHILGSSQPLSFINSYLWVLQTYNRVYDLNHPWSYFLTPANAAKVEKNGVWTSVDRNPQKLFTRGFREGVLNGTDEAFLAALRNNDIHDWNPKAPVILFHGTADDYVPFFNSEDAYKAMQARGATKVQLIRIDGANHGTAVPNYIAGVVALFGAY